MNRHTALDSFFARLPRSSAEITRASSAAPSSRISPTGKFGGKVYAGNPKYSEALAVRCYPKIAALLEKIDLAVVVTPAFTVPCLIRECVAAGVRSAIVISAGFKERGTQGIELERQIQEAACAW